MLFDVVTIASTAFAEVVTRWARFFWIDLGDTGVRMGQIVKAALSSLPEAETVQPVVLPDDELNGPADA